MKAVVDSDFRADFLDGEVAGLQQPGREFIPHDLPVAGRRTAGRLPEPLEKSGDGESGPVGEFGVVRVSAGWFRSRSQAAAMQAVDSPLPDRFRGELKQ